MRSNGSLRRSPPTRPHMASPTPTSWTRTRSSSVRRRYAEPTLAVVVQRNRNGLDGHVHGPPPERFISLNEIVRLVNLTGIPAFPKVICSSLIAQVPILRGARAGGTTEATPTGFQ